MMNFIMQLKNLKIYVDKTELLRFTNSVLSGEHRNICVSRPRRFGKSMAASRRTCCLLLQKL